MKVLIINTVRFHINGMSTIIMNYHKYIDESKIHFDFVVNEYIEDIYRKQIEEKNGKIFILKNRNKFPFLYIKNLRKIIRQGNYDVIHIHGNSALMTVELIASNKERKAKKLVHAHNTDCTHKIIHKFLYNKFIKSFDYALACSDAAGKWLYGDNKYIVINNGIDERNFSFDINLRNKLRAEQNISGNFVMLHVGLFNKQKNHDFLIDIFYEVIKREPEAILRLVGQGDLLNNIKNKVRSLGIENNVMFAGTTNNPEKEYNMADVLVFPSLYESFGLVTVEAQCTGLPCVVSDNVPKDIKITDDIDFLSLNESPEVWADTILKYNGKNSRRSYDREVVEHNYSIAEEAKKLSAFYEKICRE